MMWNSVGSEYTVRPLSVYRSVTAAGVPSTDCTHPALSSLNIFHIFWNPKKEIFSAVWNIQCFHTVLHLLLNDLYTYFYISLNFLFSCSLIFNSLLSLSNVCLDQICVRLLNMERQFTPSSSSPPSVFLYLYRPFCLSFTDNTQPDIDRFCLLHLPVFFRLLSPALIPLRRYPRPNYHCSLFFSSSF